MTKNKQKLTTLQKVLLVNGGMAHRLRRQPKPFSAPKRTPRDG